MNYLEQKKIVHRDLAARNVLVGNDRCAKIADFGLAQFTDGNGYYQHTTRTRALPVKWYALEALKHSRFSHRSDVWSFGVTLYEMFTFGDSPDLKHSSDLNTENIIQLLEDGERLPRPDFCSEEIYQDLMFSCWNKNPKVRPTFSELMERAKEHILVPLQ